VLARVLVVEDEAKVAQALHRGLTAEQYDVTVASTGEDAFFLASSIGCEAMRFGVAVSLYSSKPYTLLAGQDLFNNGRGTARPDGVARNTRSGPGYADVDLRWSRDLFVHQGQGHDEGKFSASAWMPSTC
jgi:hypothetical protein